MKTILENTFIRKVWMAIKVKLAVASEVKTKIKSKLCHRHPCCGGMPGSLLQNNNKMRKSLFSQCQPFEKKIILVDSGKYHDLLLVN